MLAFLFLSEIILSISLLQFYFVCGLYLKLQPQFAFVVVKKLLSLLRNQFILMNELSKDTLFIVLYGIKHNKSM